MLLGDFVVNRPAVEFHTVPEAASLVEAAFAHRDSYKHLLNQETNISLIVLFASLLNRLEKLRETSKEEASGITFVNLLDAVEVIGNKVTSAVTTSYIDNGEQPVHLNQLSPDVVAAWHASYFLKAAIGDYSRDLN